MNFVAHKCRFVSGTGLEIIFLIASLLLPNASWATPANRAALAKHFDQFLPKNLNKCTTCHLPSDNKNPESLEEFPHNSFGTRLHAVGKELAIADRFARVAVEDADADGVDNLSEILLGHYPGSAADKPTEKELAEIKTRQREFEKFLAGYRWQPFETVKRVEVPKVNNKRWVRNPIDAFIAAEHDAKKLKPRPEAPKHILLRRVYLDLIGLAPTSQELADFEKDKSPEAYEKVVERLLADPRYGERWGRHWMDVWRYSDWAGYNAEVRDSKPHIWRWRDWIVESLNEDKGYDKMLLEMVAADELYPEDTNSLRATGFLVRNYKMLSREQWLTDTVHHTGKAFLGITMNCAKCHDHMYDPISQAEYYKFRAIFEPHFVRTDRVPGQHDTSKDGLVRVYDVDTNPPTYIFYRGDERSPDTNRMMAPGVPAVFGGSLKIEPTKIPRRAAFPDKRDFAERGAIEASEKAVPPAREAFEKVKADTNSTPKQIADAELKFLIADGNHVSLLAALKAEHLADDGKKDSEDWKIAATNAVIAQRKLAISKAKLALDQAREKQSAVQTKLDGIIKAAEEKEKAGKDPNDVAVAKLSIEKVSEDLKKAKSSTDDTEKALANAEKENTETPNTNYKPSSTEIYPEVSTGRRTAFARWMVDQKNPLTARVAMNHIWQRHFDRAIVPTTSDFGLNGRPPTHPQLLDWLAAEFMAQNWSMKAMHRLIMTSSAYRMDAMFDKANAKIDPENIYLWRMPSKRMEAEAVRDNLLYVGGDLDLKMGGAEIPAAQGLTSKRRSLYLRIAPEKEVAFLKIFDGPDPVECYARRPTVMPHQALALANSELAFAEARLLSGELAKRCGEDKRDFVNEAFVRVLGRKPTRQEMRECISFLEQQSKWLEGQKPTVENAKEEKDKAGSANKAPTPTQRAREDLILVLFNHNDFVTIR